MECVHFGFQHRLSADVVFSQDVVQRQGFFQAVNGFFQLFAFVVNLRQPAFVVGEQHLAEHPAHTQKAH